MYNQPLHPTRKHARFFEVNSGSRPASVIAAMRRRAGELVVPKARPFGPRLWNAELTVPAQHLIPAALRAFGTKRWTRNFPAIINRKRPLYQENSGQLGISCKIKF
ncbi:MAG: hypothetical protein ACL93V_16635 [Candidatus Electrothrix sp. YB6]